MKAPRINLAISLFVLFAVGLACNYFKPQVKENSNNANTKNSNNSTTEEKKPKRDPNEKTFKGTIYTDPPSPLVMTLKREGDQLTGSYYYLKTRKDIVLKGTIDKNGKFKLEETSEGKVTGTFTGDWKDTDREPMAMLEGQWKKAGSSEEWGFYANEQAVELSSDKKIEDKAINEENKKLRYSINAYVPQISGFGANNDAINKDILSSVNKDIAGFKKTMEEIAGEPPVSGSDVSYSLDVSNNTMIATDDLLSFELTFYDYSGGAHPNSYTRTFTYDVKSGKRLQLRELFKSNTNYLKPISDYCIEALKKQMRDVENGIEPDEKWIKEGAGPKDENYGNWSVSKKGLVVTFDPYQVAPYAAGPQVVVVPYKILKDIVKEDGALSPFVK